MAAFSGHDFSDTRYPILVGFVHKDGLECLLISKKVMAFVSGVLNSTLLIFKGFIVLNCP